MTTDNPPKRRRGRPPKTEREFTDTKAQLLRSGLELITEYGFIAAGVDPIVKNVQVPKGSFYHYFKSKEDFGQQVLTAYGSYFAHKLDKHLLDETLTPLARIDSFVENAKQGMTQYQFKRGCLVGNMMQEVPQLSEALSAQLREIISDWQMRIGQCLELAKAHGEIAADANTDRLASVFWSGWEGAVMRAKLFQSVEPLDEFWAYYRFTSTTTRPLI
ncbi:Transcriptional regulator AcuR [Vibrio aerogenes CECT 7868]|uniref:Transcriptional regulator AcuR n=1 Tax=Vibrio aerogenes CECT 7868 TaxID=1216006 RepID=A0A1M5Z5C8_9VIBR|nr:TetR/AcrR family transcriptional regulator [Vibrio aerogenes]SHI19410.1 Transcriptional regulator AcuR [Vibrio aerogenes CECT 7868]